MNISDKERNQLRQLASRWMEQAALPVMKPRRQGWKDVKDLKAGKPMILVETCMLDGYIRDEELVCQDPYLRNIEKALFETVRHAEEVGDDIVMDPYFRIPWILEMSDYGIPMEPQHSAAGDGSSLGYDFKYALHSEKDLAKMHLRERVLHREESINNKELLDDTFGDILPVVLGGFDWFNRDPGYHTWLGNLYNGLTQDLFKMVGNDQLLFWFYDKPELIHDIMRIITDDRLAHFKFLEDNGLVYQNTDTWNPGPCSYGMTSDLPESDGSGKPAKLKDCWLWMESQESEPISGEMMDEFFMPYMAEACEPGGLVYYGCCERLDDRFEYVSQKIPNLRAVSVSGWSDFYKMGELLGKDYVYSRKPTPAYISNAEPNWELLEKDIDDTLAAARDCSLELCFRDIYTTDGDRQRLADWTQMVRGKIGE